MNPAVPDRVWYALGHPHAAPELPLGVSEAHSTMQRHRGCLREDCPRKQAAYQVLVEAGRIRPDSSRY